MRVLVGIALVLALAACGGVTPLTAAQVKHCSVHVYFATAATRAQENAVAAKLRDDSRVVKVTFASKAKALAKMKKEYPSLVSVLHDNPLPDSYTAVPDQLSDADAIATSVDHFPGVATVKDGSELPHLCSA